MSVSRSPVVLEGVLCKWTNYWNGWQPRWFVLEQGDLIYYKSPDEVSQGCKGSVKVSACEIVPHALDPKRLDIIIPSEQHYCLRAHSETERQKWLVALGSVKQAAFSAENATAGPKSSVTELVSTVKKKKSKLRLYCDLLMQQVHTIKTSNDFNEKTQAAELLNMTCDMFIHCLDEYMESTETGAGEGESKDSRPTIPGFNAPQSAITGMVGGLERQKRSLSLTQRSSSIPSQHIPRVTSSRVDLVTTETSQNKQERDTSEPQCDEVFLDLNGNSDEIRTLKISEVPSNQAQENPDIGGEVATYFSLMDHSFRDLKLQNTNIPAEEFLLCCQAILPVFDVLGSTAFAPVKMDIQGNIDKLEKHRKEVKCEFVQDLVRLELEQKTTSMRGSATDALLWLKRALAFVCSFLSLACLEGEIDLVLCATKAYGETLKKHHNFVVKGVFLVALRALPCYSTFVKSLAPSKEVANNPAYEANLKKHGIQYTGKLQSIITIIDTFYVRNDIIPPQKL